MTYYSVKLTGPDEEKLLRLAKKYGHPRIGSFLRRAVQEFPEHEDAIKPFTLMGNVSQVEHEQTPLQEKLKERLNQDKLDQFFKEQNTPNISDISPENKSLMLKIYVLNNYYEKNGSDKDRNMCHLWMGKLLSGISLFDSGISVIEREFRRKIMPSIDKKKWFVKNESMQEADIYISEYLVSET